MANSQFTIQDVPVYIAADDDQRKQVTITGNGVVYGDQDVTHEDYEGEVKDTKTVVLSTGRWFVSQGSSLVVVQDTDATPDIKPPEDRSQRKSKPERKASGPKASPSKGSTDKQKQ